MRSRRANRTIRQPRLSPNTRSLTKFLLELTANSPSASALATPRGTRSDCAQPTCIPLYVDLDGTLVVGDIALESLARMLLTAPWRLVPVLGAARHGRAAAKQALARSSPFDPAQLTYRTSVLDYVTQARREGRPVMLATAANESIANAVANHLGVFDDVLASDAHHNLSGRAKLSAIQTHAGTLSAFEYIGNAHEDVDICAAADEAIMVAPARAVERQVSAQPHIVVRDARNDPGSLRTVLKAIRTHQWAKNTLTFLPLLLAHRFADADALLRVGAGFFAFSLTASSIYLVNDVLDVEADRQHRRKQTRPIASGALGVIQALTIAVVMLVVGITIGSVIGAEFLLVLCGYAAISVAYSLRLKRLVVLDVFVLATLYTMRVLAGGAAAQVPISPWFFAFTVFFFLSLALLKRHTELAETGLDSVGSLIPGRGYQAGDLNMVRSAGVSAGYLAVVVLTLYLASPDVVALYKHPTRLFPTGMLLLYWVTRMWLLAGRGQVHDDPVVFALKDRASYLIGIMIIACLASAVVL